MREATPRKPHAAKCNSVSFPVWVALELAQQFKKGSVKCSEGGHHRLSETQAQAIE